MPLTEPSEFIARGFYRLAKTICGTAQFQTETGKSADTSLEENCDWPSVQGANITAPMCLITDEDELLRTKHWARIGTGALWLQLVLIEDDTITDPAASIQRRNRYTDCMDRMALIMRQALDLGQSDGATYWPIKDYTIPLGIRKNDRDEYVIENESDEEVTVWVGGFIVSF